MLSATDFERLQREQYKHDHRNHADIQCLAKPERLKHYGLHFAKYVGRLARGVSESKPVNRTLTDTFLVVLSAANTLHQDLAKALIACQSEAPAQHDDPVYVLGDLSGRFADACEKIDHMEDFPAMARAANLEIAQWLVKYASARGLDLDKEVRVRRKELAERHFYIAD